MLTIWKILSTLLKSMGFPKKINWIAKFKGRKKSWFLQHGQRITANLVKIEVENLPSLTFPRGRVPIPKRHSKWKHRHHYTLIAKWENPLDQKNYIFTLQSSKNIKELLKQKKSPGVPVIIDPNDPSQYYVDLLP